MTFQRKRLGKLGEDIACELLLKSGYKILERNFTTKVGEIDIVAQDGNSLVLVEVKTRFPGQFSLPEEAVTPFKIRHIARAGEYYQLLHPNNLDGPRIDVVAIEFGADGKVRREEILKSVTS